MVALVQDVSLFGMVVWLYTRVKYGGDPGCCNLVARCEWAVHGDVWHPDPGRPHSLSRISNPVT
jgi:hypothetical protein